MFGYISPLQNELKIKEYNYFKSYYCGLCYCLKDNFGNIPRLTLNYDLTFIGFLLDGLSKSPLKNKKVRCIKHPVNPSFIYEKTVALDYVSNLSILMFNYKLKDNISDDNSFKSKVYLSILSPNNRKIRNQYNNIQKIIQQNIAYLSYLEENKNFSSLDEICHPFADIMGMILKLYPYEFEDDSELIRNYLYKLGYFIGKWIYLIDALDDLETDIKKNKFNPYNILYNENNLNYKDLVNTIIFDIDFNVLNSISECSDYLGKINFKKHNEILKNIIELGMPNKYYEILYRINNSLEKEDA